VYFAFARPLIPFGIQLDHSNRKSGSHQDQVPFMMKLRDLHLTPLRAAQQEHVGWKIQHCGLMNASDSLHVIAKLYKDLELVS
jgi:hypothetical protein